MNAQTHYPDCWRDPRKHPECALQKIDALEHALHQCRQAGVRASVEAARVPVLEQQIAEAQRELGRKDFEIQQLNEQLAREVE